MSIQIPCPQCGRELKLPDRTLLGRKGKCPKCGHTFMLEEPAAVTLELARPEALSFGAPAVAESRSAPAFLASPAPANAPPTPNSAVVSDFAALESAAQSKGPAARLKELQKKNARQRNIGIGIAAIALVAIGVGVMFAPKFGPHKTGVAPGSEEADSTDNSGGVDTEFTGGEGLNPSATKFAKMGSPTKGKPISLQYIPFGTQVLINLHPAELWKEGSLGEEIRYCIPPIAKFVESTLNDLFKRKPEQVEELMICLIPGTRGSMPDIAAVAHMVEEQKRSQLMDQFGTRVETYGEPVYLSGERAYMIVDQKTLVVCPKAQAQEMVNAIKDFPETEEITPLLPSTDRDRNVTVVFTPMTLSLQESWFPDNFRLFVKNAVEWLGEDLKGMSCSFHLTDDLFYSEILLRNKGSSVKKFEHEFKSRLDALAGTLVSLIGQMNPKEQGKQMVIGRLPAMVEVFSMATIVHHGTNHVQLVTPLPDRAAANMVLGTLLAWDESTRTDFTKAKPVPVESKVPAMVADRLKMKIDVDFRAMPLNEAFTYIGGEIKTQIDIDGDGLKLGGFTKNIRQEFRMDAATAQDVILKIFDVSKGISSVDPTKNLVLIVDEKRKTILVTTTAAAERHGYQPYVFAK